jgi:hypothetical protein
MCVEQQTPIVYIPIVKNGIVQHLVLSRSGSPGVINPDRKIERTIGIYKIVGDIKKL